MVMLSRLCYEMGHLGRRMLRSTQSREHSLSSPNDVVQLCTEALQLDSRGASSVVVRDEELKTSNQIPTEYHQSQILRCSAVCVVLHTFEL